MHCLTRLGSIAEILVPACPKSQIFVLRVHDIRSIHLCTKTQCVCISSTQVLVLWQLSLLRRKSQNEGWRSQIPYVLCQEYRPQLADSSEFSKRARDSRKFNNTPSISNVIISNVSALSNSALTLFSMTVRYMLSSFCSSADSIPYIIISFRFLANLLPSRINDI